MLVERHSPSTHRLMILTLRSLMAHRNLRDIVRGYGVDYENNNSTNIQPDPLRIELS